MPIKHFTADKCILFPKKNWPQEPLAAELHPSRAVPIYAVPLGCSTEARLRSLRRSPRIEAMIAMCKVLQNLAGKLPSRKPNNIISIKDMSKILLDILSHPFIIHYETEKHYKMPHCCISWFIVVGASRLASWQISAQPTGGDHILRASPYNLHPMSLQLLCFISFSTIQYHTSIFIQIHLHTFHDPFSHPFIPNPNQCTIQIR